MSDLKTVLIVEDHPLLGDGLKGEIENSTGYEVVGEAPDAEEGLRLAKKFKPDIVVIVIGSPGIDGIKLTRMITRDLENTYVVIFSTHDEPDFIVRAVKAGVSGYVIKESGTDTVLQCFKAVTAGRKFMDPLMSITLLEMTAMSGISQSQADDELRKYSLLTLREQEVMRLLTEGSDLAEISSKLGISYNTASSHKSSIMKKLDFEDITELVQMAANIGITG